MVELQLLLWLVPSAELRLQEPAQACALSPLDAGTVHNIVTNAQQVLLDTRGTSLPTEHMGAVIALLLRVRTRGCGVAVVPVVPSHTFWGHPMLLEV